MIKRLLPTGDFTRSVAVLAGGTALANVVFILALPVKARLYLKEDFGILGVYLAVVSVLAAISCGKYELAIMLPDEDEDASALLVLSLVLTFGVAVLTAIAIGVLGGPVTAWFKREEIALYLWLIPIGVFLSGVFLALNYWFTRTKSFKLQSKTRITQALVTIVVQVAVGAIHGGPLGLVGGLILGQIAAVALLVINLRATGFRRSAVSSAAIRSVAARYRKFPLVSTWAVFANQTAQLVPVSFLTAHFGLAATGLYTMAKGILGLPSRLVGNATSRVLFQRAAEEKREEGNATHAVRSTLLLLAGLSILPFLIIFFFGSDIFAFVFGEEWRTAGRFAGLLVPLFWVRFAVGPLSVTNAVFERQGVGALWQIGLVGVTFAAYALLGGYGIHALLGGSAAVISLWYVVLLVILMKVARNVRRS